jgi:hypothetical protein
VFKVAPDGTETVLYTFSGSGDGGEPEGGLIFDAAGNVFGATEAGGDPGCGQYGCPVVYELAPGGAETVLYSFDDVNPAGSLLRIGKQFYGTSCCGGADWGLVYRLQK